MGVFHMYCCSIGSESGDTDAGDRYMIVPMVPFHPAFWTHTHHNPHHLVNCALLFPSFIFFLSPPPYPPFLLLTLPSSFLPSLPPSYPPFLLLTLPSSSLPSLPPHCCSYPSSHPSSHPPPHPLPSLFTLPLHRHPLSFLEDIFHMS